MRDENHDFQKELRREGRPLKGEVPRELAHLCLSPRRGDSQPRGPSGRGGDGEVYPKRWRGKGVLKIEGLKENLLSYLTGSRAEQLLPRTGSACESCQRV